MLIKRAYTYASMQFTENYEDGTWCQLEKKNIDYLLLKSLFKRLGNQRYTRKNIYHNGVKMNGWSGDTGKDFYKFSSSDSNTNTNKYLWFCRLHKQKKIYELNEATMEK